MLRIIVICLIAISSIASGQGLSPAPAEPATRHSPAEEKTTISSVRIAAPYIALTFDDGPNEKLTPRLLDLLAQHHIHVTFFVLGECAERNPEILRRAAREGHEIGNHSWSHPNFAKMSDETVRTQIKRTEELITNTIGKRPTLLRPPYGSITARQKRLIHDDLGYEIILWDVDPLDWKNPGPTVVANRILKETRPGSIVLSHDIHAQTIEAMPATLNELQAKGFKFVTVSELLQMGRSQPAAALSTTPASTASVLPTPTPETSPGG
jgi:peptidoglycan-N-acetylglucosamine deacetylase